MTANTHAQRPAREPRERPGRWSGMLGGGHLLSAVYARPAPISISTDMTTGPGLEFRESCVHFSAHCPTARFRQRTVGLRQAPRPLLDWDPVPSATTGESPIGTSRGRGVEHLDRDIGADGQSREADLGECRQHRLTGPVATSTTL